MKLERTIRRRQIAEAALKLIARDGLQGLNIAKITREIGLVPAAFYRHFESKEEVLHAVLDLIRSQLLGMVRKACRESAEPLEQLQRLLFLHLDLVQKNQGIPRLVFSEEWFLSHPGRRQKILDIISAYLNRVAGIIRTGQTEGKIRRTPPPEVLAVLFLGLIQPAAILQLLSGREFDAKGHAAQIWPLFKEMLGPPAGPRSGNQKDFF